MTTDLSPRADENAVSYVTMLPGKPGRRMCVTGVKFEATQNTTTNNDKDFPEVREIQGAWLDVTDHEPGDYIELTFRGNIGAGEIELGKFGETIYIPPSGQVVQIVSEGTVSIPVGFKLRMSYFAVAAGSMRTVYGYYRLRK